MRLYASKLALSCKNTSITKNSATSHAIATGRFVSRYIFCVDKSWKSRSIRARNLCLPVEPSSRRHSTLAIRESDRKVPRKTATRVRLIVTRWIQRSHYAVTTTTTVCCSIATRKQSRERDFTQQYSKLSTCRLRFVYFAIDYIHHWCKTF